MDWFLVFTFGFVAQKICAIVRSSDRWEASWVWRQNPIKCRCCGTYKRLKLAESCTQYTWDGKWFDPKNPNGPILLCPHCTEAHYEHWEDMWADYYSGRL